MDDQSIDRTVRTSRDVAMPRRETSEVGAAVFDNIQKSILEGLTAEGLPSYPDSYWQGITRGMNVKTEAGKQAIQAWTNTWRSSPEGVEWLKANAKTPAVTPPPALVGAGVASSAAQRQRRRAAAGNAGRVSTGTPTALQAQIGATGAPRTLIGS